MQIQSIMNLLETSLERDLSGSSVATMPRLGSSTKRKASSASDRRHALAGGASRRIADADPPARGGVARPPPPPSPAAAAGEAPPGDDDGPVAFVDDASGLRRIADDGVQLAVWRRPSPPPFAAELSDPSLGPGDLPTFEGNVPARPGAVAEVLRRHLRRTTPRRGPDGGGGWDGLAEHVDLLANAFADVALADDDGDGDGSRRVSVKLQAVDDDRCRFWHQDRVAYRLVTTYRGPCTEYVDPEHARRTLQRRRLDSEHAKSLTHRDVALFKGTGNKCTELMGQRGIVHRSPRVEASGVCRLMLVIDAPSEFDGGHRHD